MHCSHEGTNRTLDESPLCHVVPCRACSTLRGANARGAECGSSQRLPHVNLMRTLVVLNVVPVNACSTLCGMNARYADVIPGNVVLPSAVARITSRSVVYASTWRSINARAQPAVAADALRATRLGLFWSIIRADVHPILDSAPLNGKPVSWQAIIPLSYLTALV